MPASVGQQNLWGLDRDAMWRGTGEEKRSGEGRRRKDGIVGSGNDCAGRYAGGRCWMVRGSRELVVVFVCSESFVWWEGILQQKSKTQFYFIFI